MPDYTTRLGIPKPKNDRSERADILIVRSVADALDVAAVYRSGTLANRPVSTPISPGLAGQLYRASDGPLALDTGQGWDEIVRGTDPRLAVLVSSLPSSPVDGQEIYFQNAALATAGIAWHLRYRAASASAYKWEVLGEPPPLRAQYVGNRSGGVQSSGVWFNVADGNDPQLAVPLAGEYDVSSQIGYILGTPSNSVTHAVSVNAVDTILGGAGAEPVSWVSSGTLTSMHVTFRKTATAAGHVIKQRHQHAAGTGFAYLIGNQLLQLRPVRVG